MGDAYEPHVTMVCNVLQMLHESGVLSVPFTLQRAPRTTCDGGVALLQGYKSLPL